MSILLTRLATEGKEARLCGPEGEGRQGRKIEAAEAEEAEDRSRRRGQVHTDVEEDVRALSFFFLCCIVDGSVVKKKKKILLEQPRFFW
jgi:hypothetical protein